MPFFKLGNEEECSVRVRGGSSASFVRSNECREAALDSLALAVADSRRAIQWTAHVRNRLSHVSSCVAVWKPGESEQVLSAASDARVYIRRLRGRLDEMERLLDEGVGIVLEFDGSGVEFDDGEQSDRPGVSEVLEEVVVGLPGECGDRRVGGIAVDGDGDGRSGVDECPASAVVVPACPVVADCSRDGGQDPESLDAGLHAGAVDVDLDAVEDLVEVHESSSSVGGDASSSASDLCTSEPTEGDVPSEGEGFLAAASALEQWAMKRAGLVPSIAMMSLVIPKSKAEEIVREALRRVESGEGLD